MNKLIWCRQRDKHTCNDGKSFKLTGLKTVNFSENFLSGHNDMQITTFALYFILPKEPMNDDGKSGGRVHMKL